MGMKEIIINEALQRLGTAFGANVVQGIGSAQSPSITAEINFENALTALLSSYATEHSRYASLYERYKASQTGTPIFNRIMPDFMKIDSHINNSFMSEVIDTKQGYMIGIPISYSTAPYILDDKTEEQLKVEKKEMYAVFNQVRQFHTENALHDLNMETIKMSSICGTSARLLSINGIVDRTPIIKAMNINPWEVIFIYNDSHTEVEVAIRYYTKVIVHTENNVRKPVEVIHVDIYDKQFMYAYEQDAKRNWFEQPVFLNMYRRIHFFKQVPIFEYVNNKEKQGDCDKVLALIDAYDRAFSDLSSELEQFRLAYIALYGLKAKSEDLDKLRQTGMFEMTKDGKVEFITKKLDIKELMAYFDRVENNIVRFSKSVNFKDENFYGNLSGVAIRYKLMQLEEKAMTTQVKFETADSYMWKLIQTVYNIFSIPFNYLYIKRQFTRTIPVNMLEEARIQTELEGKVSTKTRLSIASFIEDPELEEQKLQREKIANKELGIDFMNTGSTARIVDIEAGGPTNRNTNGTVEGG